tara:strand:- start:2 stop:442 length:441 start_codon:yes stop_codon:yes gene_type:complete
MKKMILFISILFCFSCKEEDLIFENPYQLQTAWKGTGYGQGTILWAKQINLNYEIFYDIIPDYKNSDSNFQTFDVDIAKLADTTHVKVIFTFDCEQGDEEIRDMKPDYFDIKGEVFVNFYKDKRTIIEVSPSSNYSCDPNFKVFYE